MSRYSIAVVVLICTLLAFAQQKPHTPAQPAASTKSAPNMPSEETVRAFLQQTFGYEPDVTWKIDSIKPAPAEGLTEVDVLIRNPKGANLNKLYVTADGKHAVIGDIIPFGARPYDDAREELKRKVTGPSRGPADAPVTIVEFSDLQ